MNYLVYQRVKRYGETDSNSSVPDRLHMHKDDVHRPTDHSPTDPSSVHSVDNPTGHVDPISSIYWITTYDQEMRHGQNLQMYRNGMSMQNVLRVFHIQEAYLEQWLDNVKDMNRFILGIGVGTK